MVAQLELITGKAPAETTAWAGAEVSDRLEEMLGRYLGASILAACFIVDLPDLGGSARLAALDVPVRTLVAFHGH